MIYEKINLTVDVEKLRQHFYANVAKLRPMMNGPMFGGWSMLSYTGEYTDGWQNGSACLKVDANGKTYFDRELAARMGLQPDNEHTKPTPLCTGHVLDVLDQIRALGLKPSRARWSILRPRGQSVLHRDMPDDRYAVRLHIPLITNEQCTFHSDGEFAHLPADGSVYLLRVNRMHQVFNRSDRDRVHIIMSVWDAMGISKYHRVTETVAPSIAIND